MRTTFFQYFHMPLLIILFILLWIMLAFRLSTFFKYRRQYVYGWRTLNGLSVLSSICAGLFLTIYIALNAGIFGTDQELFMFFDRFVDIDAMDLSEMSDSECSWVIGLVKSMMEMAFACRIFLTLALWTVKASLCAMYLQSAPIVRPKPRLVFYAAGPIIVLTLGVVIWLTYQSIVTVLMYPTASDIRQGLYVDGVTFWELDDPTELTITLLNIATDVLLTYLAYQTVLALHTHGITKSNGWLLCLMGATTIVVALIRVIFEIVSISCTNACYATGTLDRLMPPIMVMGEVEAFTAIIVSCLPGLRAVLRAEDEEKKEVGTSYLAASRSGTLLSPASSSETQY